ncbi:aromatic acid exporter family protein [Saccharopolyspora gregorii]|uniref:FUSC family protein n=1 Tax=Saccharopolyspora gregorii TaxID=33914 RepID=A0ABP6RTK9_9PSEU
MTSQEPGPGGAAGGPELLRRGLRSLSEHVRDHADTWLLLLKSVVAATLSWWIAAGALGAQAASFAPFSAVLLVHSTVSRSLNHSVRYLAAMVSGIVLAGAPRSFTGHHYTVNALTRVINELQSVARSLDTDDEAEGEPQRRWTSSFGELLSAVGEACRSLGEVHSAADLRDGGELADRVERARRCGAELAERRVAEGIDAATPWPIFRALTTDARRLVDDLISAHDDLKRLG